MADTNVLAWFIFGPCSNRWPGLVCYYVKTSASPECGDPTALPDGYCKPCQGLCKPGRLYVDETVCMSSPQIARDHFSLPQRGIILVLTLIG